MPVWSRETLCRSLNDQQRIPQVFLRSLCGYLVFAAALYGPEEWRTRRRGGAEVKGNLIPKAVVDAAMKLRLEIGAELIGRV